MGLKWWVRGPRKSSILMIVVVEIETVAFGERMGMWEVFSVMQEEASP